MITVKPFEAKHLKALWDRNARSHARNTSDEALKALESTGLNRTVLFGDRVLFCGGVVEYWKDRGECWAVFDPECKEHFLEIHNAVKKYLSQCKVRRIEAAVDIDYPQGHRWVKTLGFDLENPLAQAYRPDGGSCSIYSKVRAYG